MENNADIKGIKEELLFCSALDTTTKASDAMEKVNHFFNENEIPWKNLCAVCNDGAPLGQFLRHKVGTFLMYTRG